MTDKQYEGLIVTLRAIHELLKEQTTLARSQAQLMTKKECAEMLRCVPRTVEELQRARKIPVVRLSARCVRYRREAVLDALTRKWEQKAIGD